MMLYKWKIQRIRGGDESTVDRGERESYSKLHVRDKLAQDPNFLRIPMNRIVVWDARNPEPDFPQPGKKAASSPHEHFSFMARDGGQNTWRVWRRGWSGDQFEVLNPAEFEALQAMAKRFGITVKILGQEEDN